MLGSKDRFIKRLEEDIEVLQSDLKDAKAHLCPNFNHEITHSYDYRHETISPHCLLMSRNDELNKDIAKLNHTILELTKLVSKHKKKK